jgi:polar amino acid transport system substrate-binding protein
MTTRGSRRLLAVLAGMAIILAACSSAGGGASRAASAGASAAAGDIPPAGATIDVGSTLDLAPLDFVDANGNPTGYELDVVMAAMDKLGYKINWVKTPFEQAFTGLLANKYRFNASAIYTRCKRVKDKDHFGQFTVPVGQAGQAVTTPNATADAIKAFTDLKGKTLGVESAGSTADGVADENAAAGFTKQILPDNNSLFLALEQGRIDAALQSSDVSRYTIRDKTGVKVAFIVPDSTLTYGWVFRAGDPFRDKINETINELKKDGTTATIYKKWFGSDPEATDAAVAIVPEVTPDTCKG